MILSKGTKNIRENIMLNIQQFTEIKSENSKSNTLSIQRDNISS
jgi:hypothetical protein